MLIVFVSTFGRNLNYPKPLLQAYTANQNIKIKAYLSISGNEKVYLESENLQTILFPISYFSQTDQLHKQK